MVGTRDVSSLYNSKQKQEYLNTLTETDFKLVFPTFNKIAEIEEKYDTDFSKMNRSQIVECCKVFGKESCIRPAFSRLRKYAYWCKETGRNEGLNYSSPAVITVNEIINYIGQTEKRYYISPEKYEEYKQILKNSPNGVYLTSLFMACYEGLAGDRMENLINMRLKDIIKNNPISLPNGDKRYISNELKELMIECCSITELIGRNTTHLRYSEYPDTIWRSSRDAKNKRRKFIAAFDNVGRIKDILNDREVTAETLEQSGLFNYVLRRSKELGYDLKKDMEENLPLIRRTGSGKGYYVESEISKKYDDILEEYGAYEKFYSFKRRYKDFIQHI